MRSMESGKRKRVGSPEKGHSMINMEQYVIWKQRRSREDQRQGCETPQNSEEGDRVAEVSASEVMGLKDAPQN